VLEKDNDEMVLFGVHVFFPTFIRFNIRIYTVKRVRGKREREQRKISITTKG